MLPKNVELTNRQLKTPKGTFLLNNDAFYFAEHESIIAALPELFIEAIIGILIIAAVVIGAFYFFPNSNIPSAVSVIALGILATGLFGGVNGLLNHRPHHLYCVTDGKKMCLYTSSESNCAALLNKIEEITKQDDS